MTKAFGILTMFVLLASAFLAYKNKEAYQTEITSTRTEKETLKATQKRLKIAQDNLADTIAKRTEMEGQVAKMTEQESDQKKTNTDLKSQLDAKTAEVAANKTKLDEISAKTAKVGDIKELASKMKKLKADIEELAQNIKDNETKLTGLTEDNTRTVEQINGMKTKFATISNGQSLPTLNTRIRSIYPTWGFVTLATGVSGGVVPNSTLDVVRDGATIAKLLVTAVEGNSASASIVPDSLAPDTTLMVGDRVIPNQKVVAAQQN